MALVDSLPVVQNLKLRHAAFDAWRILRAEGKYAEKLKRAHPLGAELAPYLAPLLPEMCRAAAQAEAVERYLDANRAPWGLPPTT